MADTTHDDHGHGHGHGAGDHTHGSGDHPFGLDDHEWHYVKIWALLCLLLTISVLGPFVGIVWVTLITAFGIAVVKAYLVVKHFMHLTLEPKYVAYICGTALAFMSLLFFFVAPDVMEHEGRNWDNVAAASATTAAHQGDAELSAPDVYANVCASCHGENGDGHGPSTAALRRPPSFTDAKFWEQRDRERIVQAIAEGGHGIGASRAMPAYDHRFSEEQNRTARRRRDGVPPAAGADRSRPRATPDGSDARGGGRRARRRGGRRGARCACGGLLHPPPAAPLIEPMSAPSTIAMAPPTSRREPLVPSGVLAMLVFVVTEIMFFAGLISAYVIAEGMTEGGWPPPDQPRLPIEATAVNTAALLLSGVVLFYAGRIFKSDKKRARPLFVVALLLGAGFVVFQGIEWVRLIGQGLTLTFSTHGAFFYVIVGTHGLHALAAILALGWAALAARRDALTGTALATVQIFWYFVVGVWPVLYYLVYL